MDKDTSTNKLNYIKTKDGSNTLYSNRFHQHYHSVKEGALNESLSKHILPAITYHKNKTHLYILDICFGLGYNTLATLYYIKKHNLNIKLHIYTPEFDKELIKNLKNFKYPKEFEQFKYIIDILSSTFSFENKDIKIEIYIGDARKYIKDLKNKAKFDIIYQDAFSSNVNYSLWTVEYFSDIANIVNEDAILTTYSIATPIRLSIYKNNFLIYQYKPELSNKITVALRKDTIYKGKGYNYIDMELKQQRNLKAKALYDKKD